MIGWLFGLGLLVLALASLYLVVFDKPVGFMKPFVGFMKDFKKQCDDTGFACNVATSIFFTVAPLLVGSFWFVSFTLWRVRRPVLKQAKEQPSKLVETAGEIVGRVVGRDDVCNVLQDNLRDRNDRRPYVVVGGAGIGKTAVLVRLTELLARRGAVPVPIRLRDAEKDVDFLEMARQAFVRGTQSSNWLAAEAERAWGRLCRTDKIVVLADGLEEALADRKDVDVNQERDHRVRAAVSQARKRGYPLVIASREHDALSALDAAVLQLEPLNAEAALDYIEENRRVDDENRLGRIVETADVVETPLYLQIVRELHESGQLRHTTVDTRGKRHETLETRGADRVLLRMNLAKSWVDALIAGSLEKEAARVPLNPKEREATVLHLAALACCGLAEDTLEVTFDMFGEPESRRYPKLEKGLETKLAEALKKRVKGVEEVSTEELAEALRKRVKGVEEVSTEEQRHLRVDMQVAASNGVRLGLVEPRKGGVRFPHSTMQAYLGSKLIGEALKGESFTSQAFEAPGRELLIALAMFSRRSEADGLGEGISRRSLLCMLCKAAQSAPTDVKRLELLTAAVEVDSVDKESEHRDALDKLVTAWSQANSWDEASRGAKLIAVARVGDAARRLTVAERNKEGSADAPAFGFYRRLYSICGKEDNYQIRLAAVQEIGAGGDHALKELQEKFREDKLHLEQMKTLHDVDGRYRYSVQAWILPMLVGSVGGDDDAAKRLGEWLELVGGGMPLQLEAALAQGFKFAANRRPQHPYEMAKTRAYLAARAEQMLEKAEHWFSRLTLLHALCLWALSGTLPASRDQEERRDFRAVVERWLQRGDGTEEHPFVHQAGELVVKALETRQPERFIWIDESGVATTVGSRSERERPHAMRTLWIPPSAGWLLLGRRAQQLVGDVLILLTLAERGDTEEDWAWNFGKINCASLPHCLTQERGEHLRPTDTAGVTQRSPGDTCKGGCPVHLCPYPPKGQQPYRVELSEAFCRQQRELLVRRQSPFAGRAPWQGPRSELSSYWRKMEERART
ncbi:MAG: hypothetical protein WKF33_06380 [Thermoleophilaceae bacterium]